MAIDAVPDDQRLAVNLSVWTNRDVLTAFVDLSADHRSIMRRRREWMGPTRVCLALWWIEAGQILAIDEGCARLQSLERFGPTQQAFTVKQPFPAPDGTAPLSLFRDEWA
jgi:hypothetical protein